MYVGMHVCIYSKMGLLRIVSGQERHMMCLCMYICMYETVYVYMYIHIHTHNHSNTYTQYIYIHTHTYTVHDRAIDMSNPSHG